MTKIDLRFSQMSMNTRHKLYSRPLHLSPSKIPLPLAKPSRKLSSELSEDRILRDYEDQSILESENTGESITEDHEDTDSSIEEEYPVSEESSSEVETRQLSYISLPSLHSSRSGSVNNLVPIRRKSLSASPALSFDSVAMELEEDMSEMDLPIEDTEDDSSNREDYVNVKVKVQKDPYTIVSDLVKVTVSVQPPSEIDDEGDNESIYSEEIENSGSDTEESLEEEISDRVESEDRDYSGSRQSSVESEEPNSDESEGDDKDQNDDTDNDDETNKETSDKDSQDNTGSGEYKTKNLIPMEDTLKESKILFSHEETNETLQKLASRQHSASSSKSKILFSHEEAAQMLQKLASGQHSASSLKSKISFSHEETNETLQKLTSRQHSASSSKSKISFSHEETNETLQKLASRQHSASSSKSKISFSHEEAAEMLQKLASGQHSASSSKSHNSKKQILTKELINQSSPMSDSSLTGKLETVTVDVHRSESSISDKVTETILTGSPMSNMINKMSPMSINKSPESKMKSSMSPISMHKTPVKVLEKVEEISGSQEMKNINGINNIIHSSTGNLKSQSKQHVADKGIQLNDDIKSSLSSINKSLSKANEISLNSIDEKTDSLPLISDELVTEVPIDPMSAQKAVINKFQNSLAMKTRVHPILIPKKEILVPQVPVSSIPKLPTSVTAIGAFAGRGFSILKQTDNELLKSNEITVMNEPQEGGKVTFSPKTEKKPIEINKLNAAESEHIKGRAESVEIEEDQMEKEEPDESEQIDENPEEDNEVDEYLSICAGSLDSSEDDDGNTKEKQEKVLTKDEIEEIEEKKEKLVEEWKLTIKEEFLELDENFSTIIGDMANELDLPPIVPIVPAEKIKALDADEETEVKSLESEPLKESNETDSIKSKSESINENEAENIENEIVLEKESDPENFKESESDKEQEKETDKGNVKESIPVNNTESIPGKASDNEKSQKEFMQHPLEMEEVKSIETIKLDKSNEIIVEMEEEVEGTSLKIWNLNENEEEEEDEEENPKSIRKWKNSSEIASTLSQYMGIIKTETVENNFSDIIPLLTRLLVHSRKNKSEHDFTTMIATLSAIRVFCERLLEVKAMSGEKALKNMDLSWLIRILCKTSSDDKSKVRTEASFTLARLVKASGPELITRPIYFLLVMESEGHGKKGSQGSKMKAVALDVLTYTLLTFPKEEFDDLEEIARWVGLVVFHPQRRVRQSALECVSVIGNRLGNPEKALSIFRRALVQEAQDHYSRSGSDSNTAPTNLQSFKKVLGKGIFDVSAITAIAARLKKRKLLPLPSSNGLIEYGVKVPTGQELIFLLTKLQEQEEAAFEFSSSSDESHHSEIIDIGDAESETESIRMSDLEKSAKEAALNGFKAKKQEESEEEVDGKLIRPDVAFILAGKGKVNKQEDVLLEENMKQVDKILLANSFKSLINGKKLHKKKNTKKRESKKNMHELSDDDEDKDDGSVKESEVYF